MDKVRTINHFVDLYELPNGYFKTENGTVLTPEQTKLLHQLMPDALFLNHVDYDLQRKRTDAKYEIV